MDFNSTAMLIVIFLFSVLVFKWLICCPPSHAVCYPRGVKPHHHGSRNPPSAVGSAVNCLSITPAFSNERADNFVKSLSQQFHDDNIVYTPTHPSFNSILQFSIQNLRFATQSTPKPLVIVTPKHESQIPPIISYAKRHNMEIRIRSGGHDYEGLSHVSKVPFVILDMVNLNEITVNAEEKTAWVASGARLGEFYYRIAEKSPTLGFPAGVCPTVAVGGHFSGGGHGMLLRKYGLAADNVIDARMVDVNGRILDRRSMGEDLFWAIRGGGASSFGVILSWKVKLVEVPQTVTVFKVRRTLEQNATQLVYRWQDIAHKIDRDLYVQVRLQQSQDGRNLTVSASFHSIFYGRVDQLIPLMQQSFPELGLQREDCQEMSWIQSILYFSWLPTDNLEALLDRTQPIHDIQYFKAKSDCVQKPIPVSGLERLWRLFYEPDAEGGILILTPVGGRMTEISESATPCPYRAGILYEIQHLIIWNEEKAQNSDKYISWLWRVYSYMTPYVSSSPRAALINYRDLDIGVNNEVGMTSYAQASIWGKKYFKNNFDRLVRVKTRVDPDNFFRDEQSIPPIPAPSGKL